MKSRKKQIVIAVLIAALVIGGVGTYIAVRAHDHTVAVEKAHRVVVEKEKDAETTARLALAAADRVPSESSVNSAKIAIGELTNETLKESLLKDLSDVSARLVLIDAATKAVSAYSKTQSDADFKAAQAAIAKLTDNNDAATVSSLNTQITATQKKVADAKAAQAAAEAKAAVSSKYNGNWYGANGDGSAIWKVVINDTTATIFELDNTGIPDIATGNFQKGSRQTVRFDPSSARITIASLGLTYKYSSSDNVFHCTDPDYSDYRLFRKAAWPGIAAEFTKFGW